jgi:phosphogluconate dehydratase
MIFRAAVPLLTRIYPNGPADINEFHAAGGTPFLIRTSVEHGYLHDEVETVVGKGLAHYTQMPELDDGATTLVWQPAVTSSRNAAVLRGCDEPFAMNGGLRVMQGNLGRGVIKVSAVAPSHWTVEAPHAFFMIRMLWRRHSSVASCSRTWWRWCVFRVPLLTVCLSCTS